MSVEDRWHYTDERAARRAGVTEHCPCKGRMRMYPTNDHERGKRWRVRNRGARTVSFHKNHDAKQWDAKVRTELARGLTPFDHRAGVMPFREYREKWMGEHHFTGRGRETYESWFRNHISPTLDEKRMIDIRLSTIKQWWAGMRAKRYQGRPYSASLLESVYVALGSMLRAAVIDKVIPEHPMDGWDPELPKRDKAVRNIWEQERVDTVIEALPERDRGPAIMSATCGHRPGESRAVALEDVNRFSKEIDIRHQVLWLNGKLVLVPPKNQSVRTVPLGARALNVIDTHVERYGTTLVRCVCCGRDWHVVFTNDGKLIKARDYTRVWNSALETVGLAPSRHMGQHNLRHYWVSMMIDGRATDNGTERATEKDIQIWAGHKSINTTFDKYGHLFKRSGDRARSIVDNAFPGHVYPLRTAEGQ